MVTIVTGKMNQRKTTTIKALYEKEKKGDGFILVKQMIGTRVHSYEAMRCSTNEKRVLLRHEYFYKNKDVYQQSIGPYIVDETTLNWINESIKEMIRVKTQPIFLDEIGNWELKGQGFNDILIKLLKSDLELVLTTRDSLLSEVVKKYQITKYKTIEV